MPKRIKVLARTLSYGRHQFGKGGEYVVNDAFAKKSQLEGKVQILEDMGTDETSQIEVIDKQFLEKIRYHAPQILEILESASKGESAEELIGSGNSESQAKSSESTASSDAPGSLVTNVGNSNTVLNDDIPADFPGKEDLVKKEITTMSQLKSIGYDDLIEKGLRPGLVNQIGAKLAEMSGS